MRMSVFARVMHELIPVAVVLLVVGAAAAWAAPPAETAAKTTQVARPEVKPLTPDQLDAALAGGTWLIVEFGGEHCIPCMQMQPILQDLQAALAGKARVHNFWIQQYPAVAARHKIMVMPTQIVFNSKGREVLRHMGLFPAAEFHQALREKGVF